MSLRTTLYLISKFVVNELCFDLTEVENILKFVFLGCFSWEVALGKRYRGGELLNGKKFMTNLKTDKCESFFTRQLKFFFHFIWELRCQKVLQITNTFKVRTKTRVCFKIGLLWSIFFGAILRHFQTNIIVLQKTLKRSVFLIFSRTILGNFDSKKTFIDHQNCISLKGINLNSLGDNCNISHLMWSVLNQI